MSTHSNCPLCGFEEDTNVHVIFWCPFSQELWKLIDYPFLVRHTEEISFKSVLLYATEILDKESFAKLLVYACEYGLRETKEPIANKLELHNK